ncbi:MAG: carbon storage regulator [Planctomycetota bacterium]
MLVLSRKPQQQIVIPGLNIRITILGIGTNRVHLGIEAPDDVQITRPEITKNRPAALLEDASGLPGLTIQRL